ncbi:uncharacterized protein [Dysidea avara]|uniref:uncharacterized protein isoform X2 n=1 Tax=Dysidea avara TaxID=196820 RepID=UPI00331A5099
MSPRIPQGIDPGPMNESAIRNTSPQVVDNKEQSPVSLLSSELTISSQPVKSTGSSTKRFDGSRSGKSQSSRNKRQQNDGPKANLLLHNQTGTTPSDQATDTYPPTSSPLDLFPSGDQDGVLAELPQVQEIKLPAEQSHQAGQHAAVPPHLKCSNPSCNRMKCKRDNGQYYSHCGKTCRDSCKALQPQVIRKANRQEFQQIQAHFTQKWAHQKGTCGQLHEVLVIDNPKLQQQFQTYWSSLSVQTISQHYHGTSLKCTIYQSTSVCNDRKCGICGITQRGILLEYKTSNKPGFCLALNSSECHDYTQGHGQYRAMLLFNVAEGRKHTVTNDNITLKGPPTGYDSVYGQSGGSLNYDEIVVYKPEALLPTHILIYQKDGIHKIVK